MAKAGEEVRTANDTSATRPIGTAWGLVIVFGGLAFFQGISEPTEGLVAQPVRSLLMAWGRQAGQIATFSAALGLPWAIKPLLGVLVDVVPLGRSRRTLWLVADGLIATAAFLFLAGAPEAGGTLGRMFTGLLVATIAITMADVVTDAVIVDWGHAHGRTGRYQAAQWFSLYASGLVIGTAGGFLSAHAWIRPAFLLSALAAAAMVVLAAAVVREPSPSGSQKADRVRGRQAWGELIASVRSPAVVSLAAFLFLWSFNPFAYTVLHVYMKDELGLGEQFQGDMLALFSVSSMVAAAGYGVFSRRVSMKVLAHASVVLGIMGSLVYLGMSDRRSALFVTIAAGFVTMTATLIQLELAARACPPGAAGTVFASLMAVSNLSATVASWLGGVWYERLGAIWGRPAGFRALVLIGAATTAACWLILPFLPPALLATSPRDESLT